MITAPVNPAFRDDDPPSDGACLWCGHIFRARRGGSTQRFCRARCRTAFWSALRRWGERAIAAGAPTVIDLRTRVLIDPVESSPGSASGTSDRACLRYRTNRGRSSSLIRKSSSDPVSLRRRSPRELQGGNCLRGVLAQYRGGGSLMASAESDAIRRPIASMPSARIAAAPLSRPRGRRHEHDMTQRGVMPHFEKYAVDCHCAQSIALLQCHQIVSSSSL